MKEFDRKNILTSYDNTYEALLKSTTYKDLIRDIEALKENMKIYLNISQYWQDQFDKIAYRLSNIETDYKDGLTQSLNTCNHIDCETIQTKYDDSSILYQVKCKRCGQIVGSYVN